MAGGVVMEDVVSVAQLKEDLRRAEAHQRQIREQIEQKTAKETAERQAPLRAIAQRAHDLLCGYNHMEGCGWAYEGDNWNGRAHKQWLNKVEEVLGKNKTFHPVTSEQLDKLLDCVKHVKEVHVQGMFVLGLLR
jgi:hypothetical protein